MRSIAVFVLSALSIQVSPEELLAHHDAGLLNEAIDQSLASWRLWRSPHRDLENMTLGRKWSWEARDELKLSRRRRKDISPTRIAMHEMEGKPMLATSDRIEKLLEKRKRPPSQVQHPLAAVRALSQA
eukprot:gnl/TRDRNA2_/TRDRNA2_126302_c0_seq3.p1 gnl/TRDRNA2_/TRDRNA2_126302_c0~~gnl/TRDRNA2_/TRDRNA2_126302_c0_seq3.p1  ORF type:complete len:128 (+),score=9.75 gnl/TRDRNA2_/TRDRNA2_126302_c0_seq3:91-474(+)